MAILAKAFAWSYSGLKSFESCALQFKEVNLLKNFKGTKGPEMIWGDRVHKAFAAHLQHGTPLPDEMLIYRPWMDKMKAEPGTLYVEQKYALNKDFRPTTYFAADVWYRGIGDVVCVDGSVAFVVDWKTGKVLDDPVQLLLMALCVFNHFPKVQRVKTAFVWLKFDTKNELVFTRKAMADELVGVLDRVHAMKDAYDTDNYPPHPSGLCKRHCPVSTCQYWQKGSF